MEDKVTREEFEEFKESFSNKLDLLIKRLDTHIKNQKERNEQIMALLNSPEYLELKERVTKAKKKNAIFAK